MYLMLLLRFTKHDVANAAENVFAVIRVDAGRINRGSHRHPNLAHVADDSLERLSHWSQLLRDIQSSTMHCGLFNHWLLAVEPLKLVMCGPRAQVPKPLRGVRRPSPQDPIYRTDGRLSRSSASGG